LDRIPESSEAIFGLTPKSVSALVSLGNFNDGRGALDLLLEALCGQGMPKDRSAFLDELGISRSRVALELSRLAFARGGIALSTEEAACELVMRRSWSTASDEQRSLLLSACDQARYDALRRRSMAQHKLDHMSEAQANSFFDPEKGKFTDEKKFLDLVQDAEVIRVSTKEKLRALELLATIHGDLAKESDLKNAPPGKTTIVLLAKNEKLNTQETE
jgi:hypothetical protein